MLGGADQDQTVARLHLEVASGVGERATAAPHGDDGDLMAAAQVEVGERLPGSGSAVPQGDGARVEALLVEALETTVRVFSHVLGAYLVPPAEIDRLVVSISSGTTMSAPAFWSGSTVRRKRVRAMSWSVGLR